MNLSRQKLYKLIGWIILVIERNISLMHSVPRRSAHANEFLGLLQFTSGVDNSVDRTIQNSSSNDGNLPNNHIYINEK